MDRPGILNIRQHDHRLAGLVLGSLLILLTAFRVHASTELSALDQLTPSSNIGSSI